MWDRELIVPAAMEGNYRKFGYAPAIRTGPMLHISGQVGRDETFTLVEDLRGQIRQAWTNIGIVMEAAGATPADLVDITSYHVNLADQLTIFKEERDRFLGPELSTRPCWTAIGVASLSRPGMVVEIKASAFLNRYSYGGNQ